MIFRALLIFSFGLFLSGCNSNMLALYQQTITPQYLASANVGSPDPRKPPKGEMVLVEWWLSKNAMNTEPTLVVDVLYKNFTTERLTFPIHSKVGMKSIELVNKKFKETGGFLSYKAELVTSEGEVFADWEHQLWVRLIPESETERSSSSVDE